MYSSIVAIIIAYAAVFATTTARSSEIQIRTQGTRPIHLSSVPGFDPEYRYVFPKETEPSMYSGNAAVIYEKDQQGRFIKHPLPVNQSPETWQENGGRFGVDPLDPVCLEMPSFHFPAAVKMMAKTANVKLPKLSLTWRLASPTASLSPDNVVRVYEKHAIVAPGARFRASLEYKLIHTYEVIVTAGGQEGFGNLFRFLSNPQDLLMELGWRVSGTNLMTASIQDLVFLQKQQRKKSAAPLTQEVFADDRNEEKA